MLEGSIILFWPLGSYDFSIRLLESPKTFISSISGFSDMSLAPKQLFSSLEIPGCIFGQNINMLDKFIGMKCLKAPSYYSGPFWSYNFSIR